MHLTSSPIDWYAARAGGIAAYVLLTLNVAIGLLMTGKKRMKHWPRFALEDVHRFTGLLTGTFVVLHIATVAIDRICLSRPFRSPSRSSRRTDRSGSDSASSPRSCSSRWRSRTTTGTRSSAIRRGDGTT